MQTSSTGEVSVRGPEVEVAGVKYEEIQCFLGDVDLETAEALELKRLSDCQKSLRSRLQERETSEITRHTLKIKALQKRKRAANAKAKLDGGGSGGDAEGAQGCAGEAHGAAEGDKVERDTAGELPGATRREEAEHWRSRSRRRSWRRTSSL